MFGRLTIAIPLENSGAEVVKLYFLNKPKYWGCKTKTSFYN